jgi:hypothetical protein
MYLQKYFSLFLILACLATASHAARHALVEKHGPVAPRAVWTKQDADFFKAAKKACEVKLPNALLSPSRLVTGDEITVNLPDAPHALARVDRISTDVMGFTTVRARFAGDPYGYVILSTDGSNLLADIYQASRQIRRLIRTKKGVHYLVEPDPEVDKPLEGSDSPLAPQSTPLAAPVVSQPPTGQGDGNALADGAPTTIDIMVVYTPAAKTWSAANDTSISHTINQLMAKAQLACDNSQTFITMRLVHVAEVSYTEVDPNTDLNRLTYTDGYIDNVHTLRDTYGADVVVLLEFTDATGGFGWLLSDAGGSPGYAFSLTRVQQASRTYTAIHEIGHNMGCGHHKQQKTQPGPGLYSYSAGWRWAEGANRWCSLMTYESGSYFADGTNHTRVGYFSDPNVSLNGVPTGDATNGNNAETLRQVKQAVAAYRATQVYVVSTPTFSPASGSSFTTSLVVSISCATTNATIRYTTNGSEPTTNSTLYTGALTLTETTMLKAKGFKTNMTESATATVTYNNNRPANDLFANALLISGTSGSTSGSNTFARAESGEPLHANVASATNSVWWEWTAPNNGVCSVNTLNSPIDTVLAIYTGSAVNALTGVASNNDFRYVQSIYQSLTSFTAQSNTTYYIAVAGYNGTHGTINLDWSFMPSSGLTILQNGIPVTVSGIQDSETHFKITVPTGASNLVITTSGGGGDEDCDLYVLYGAPATLGLWDYQSWLVGNNESVSVSIPETVDWYIMLNGYTAYSGVSLKAGYAQNKPSILTQSMAWSAGSTNLTIQFDGNAGKTYNIQRKDSLTNLVWDTIGTHSPTSNKLTTLIITIPSGKPTGFYRLQMP